MGTGTNAHRSINLDLGQIGTWKNEYLGKWILEKNIHIWGNRALGKWALVQMGSKANGHLGKGYSKCPNIPVPISPQMFANGQWGK